MYQYRAYGIGIHSDFKLYNFDETKTDADVYIRKIHSGLDRAECAQKKKWIEYNDDNAWVMSTFAQFFIREGKYIDVFVEKEATYIEIAAFICGWCMAFLFTQRGYSAIHCAALEFGDGCVLVSGTSGAGKTTTSLELIKRGHRFLADDIAMIRPEDDFLVRPAFPMQKICRDVAEATQNKDLLYIDADKDKFAKMNYEDFCDIPKPLKGMVMLNKSYDGDLEVTEYKGFDKYLKVFSSLFIGKLFIDNGVDKNEQYRMLKLAEKIPYLSITRPLNSDTLNEVCDAIEDFYGRE